MKIPCIIRGKRVDKELIDEIRTFLSENPQLTRKEISLQLSRRWGWRARSGGYNDRGVREVLLELERAGFITLPPSRSPHLRNRKKRIDTSVADLYVPREEWGGRIDEYPEPKIHIVEGRWERAIWEAVMEKYHPQGTPWIVGGTLRYSIWLKGRLVALMGWGSAAWHVRLRDEWLGWSKEERRANLHHVVNNIRYLIVPHVRIKNLASKVLRMVMARVARDWGKRYGEVWLYETFVDRERYRGTCYRAAGWQCLGVTRGYSKKGASYRYHGQQKLYYIYPGGEYARRKLQKKLPGHLCDSVSEGSS